MIWHKPQDLRYTQLCMYIDENLEKIKVPGENPDIENTIYNYLWLVVKALAIKKCLFNSFQDYDAYAFHAANRLFFALRKNLVNQGKTIKGKQIRPIKSCLNYMKALMYPMKIEFQNETYREVISEEFASKKFDAFNFKEQLKASARENQGVTESFRLALSEELQNIGELADKILVESPFQKGTLDYKKLKISLLLNALNSLKTKGKLDSNVQTILLWKLPKSMSSYVRILLKKFYTEIKNDIIECYKSVDIDDEVLDKLIQNSTEEQTQYEDWD